MLTVLERDATMSPGLGRYTGMDRFACREALWADMEALGLVIGREAHTMRQPRSQRGGEVVEPMLSTQWFLAMDSLAAPALAAHRGGELRFEPPRFGKVYDHWLSNIKDWCLSRQLWWGHPIPVYYIDGDGSDPAHPYLVAKSEPDARAQAVKMGYPADVPLNRDPDVLDTWFSSALWPFATLGWPEASARGDGSTGSDLERFYPTSVMETGHDILFFWVARMVMLGIEFTGGCLLCRLCCRCCSFVKHKESCDLDPAVLWGMP